MGFTVAETNKPFSNAACNEKERQEKVRPASNAFAGLISVTDRPELSGTAMDTE